MLQIIRLLPKRQFANALNNQQIRQFLSQAYYCEDVWNQRLNSPILQKAKIEEFYFELEQRFNKTRQLNALDIDIFANAIQDDQFSDELLDMVHKLRLTADTCNGLPSTSHAVVRVLLQSDKLNDLVNALDDRLNYGLFLDYYTANLLMDTFYKRNQFVLGARVASQLMLQEEFDHQLSRDFSLLHCYNYLLKPEGWPVYTPPEEPEEEVKVRVKYVRNPFDDEHFDLREDKKIVGKTLMMISKGRTDPLNQSFHLLGLVLFGKIEQAEKFSSTITQPLYKEILDLIPEEQRTDILKQIKTESENVGQILIDNVKASVNKTTESDITQQCDIFQRWEKERIKRLEEQTLRLKTARRLEDVEDLQEALKTKEERLWFFDNEEKIDLEIQAKKRYYPKRWFGHKKQPKEMDTGYVPPEVQKKHENK